MKIRLKSDFIDCYDHWFCRSDEGPDFELFRYSRSGLSRKDIFNKLEKLGFKTPKYEYVRYLPKVKSDFVVVYLDEYSHKGEYKKLCPYEKAKDIYPNYLGSEFLEEGNGFSYRLLKIGNLFFKLSYLSLDSWKSNYGTVSIKLYDYVKVNDFFKTDYPIVAIDYVLHKGYKYAFDLNTSPLIRYTGIEDLFTPKEIYNEIYNFIKRRK